MAKDSMTTTQFVARLKADPITFHRLVVADDPKKELAGIGYVPEKRFLKYLEHSLAKVLDYMSDQIHVLEQKAKDVEGNVSRPHNSGVNGSSGSNW